MRPAAKLAFAYKRPRGARPIARALDHDIAAAINMLDGAEQTAWRRANGSDQRRNRYLLTSAIASAPFILLLLASL